MPFAVHGVFCPSCGEESISYDEMNTHQLSCTNIECPRMMAVQEILSEPQKTDHIVVLTGGGYSVKHPIGERLDDQLLHCKLADIVGVRGSYRGSWRGRVRVGVPYFMRFETSEDAQRGDVTWEEVGG